MTKVYCSKCTRCRSCDYGRFCYAEEGILYTSPATYYEPEQTTLIHPIRGCKVQNKKNDCPDFKQREPEESITLPRMNSVVGRYVDEVLYKKPWWKFWRK